MSFKTSSRSNALLMYASAKNDKIIMMIIYSQA